MPDGWVGLISDDTSSQISGLSCLFATIFRVGIKRGCSFEVIFPANFTEHGFSYAVRGTQVKDEGILSLEHLVAELAHKLRNRKDSYLVFERWVS